MSDTFNKHVKLVERIKSAHYTPPISRTMVDILHATMGMVTESVELLDNWKKTFFYGGRPFDTVNADEEVGDLLWYIVLYCIARAEQEDLDPIQVFARLLDANHAKLTKRFPDRFDEDRVKMENRDTAAERAAVAEAFGKDSTQ